MVGVLFVCGVAVRRTASSASFPIIVLSKDANTRVFVSFFVKRI